ncbi:TonB-dependent receptor [Pseudoduganella namucuonensis]|uniref:Iron complex outermembrane recepter protein n=1 Tax=Pseudoduganella namucuonensis TaxID=1035707 RepID=A0A1I7LZD7_9BURK|nr:TonB-dependent receptor [Pseudoduganella namucuonensis]SFV15039.1 iron complex outermembrane recepter protein [Pseudoduganella namucuonensis]
MLEHSKFQKTAVAAAVAAFMACAAPARAQSEGAAEAPAAAPTAAPAPAAADKGQIQEVIVTAQKRASTAQKTAAAITVFDAKTLEKNGVATLQDLTKLAPGVSLGQDAAKVVVTMRGVSSRDTTEIGDPAVSISTDGFYIQRPTGLSGSVFDLERVEVLRGPQGTLYGRSATGGAINFITAKPGKELEGKVGLGIGNYGLVTSEGMINLPLGEEWAARAAFQSSRHKGYRTNEAPAVPGDDDDTTSARVHLQYTPTSRLKVLLTGQHTHIGGVGPSVEGVPIVGAVNNNVMPVVDAKGQPHGTPNQYIDTTIKSLQLNASYDLDFASLIYSGGYRDMHYLHLRDLDGLSGNANYFSANERPVDTSHELRMVSQGEGRLKWQFGGYYFKEKMDLLSYYQTYAVANSPGTIFVFDYDVLAVSKALFGQASYEVVDGLTVDIGLRGSQDEKTRSGYQNLGNGVAPQPGNISSRKNTHHLGLNWQLTPTNLLYAKYSTGYKAGGFTSVITGLGAGATVSQVSYNPETISAIEVGSKNQFFQRRLQLNLSAFTYDYKDQQVAVNNGGTSYTVNAGKSRIAGGELEFQARPTANDRFDGSIAYLKGEFKDFCTNKNTQGVCTRNLAGNEPAQAPRWQIGAGYEHGFEVPGGTLTPRIQTHYESKSYLGVDNYARQTQKSYHRSDAMLTYAEDSGKWTLQAYVRNIENAKVMTVANANFGSYNYAYSAPRTFGVKLTHSW